MTPNIVESVPNADTDGSRVKKNHYQSRIVWPVAIYLLSFHVFSAISIYLIVTGVTSLKVWSFFCLVYVLGGVFGIQCGAHRLWSHKSYKAKLPLRIFLMIWNTLAFQESILKFSRDHRVHHKHSDTDADPYNSSRGFFFCHMGAMFVKRHPDVKKYGNKIDISDLLADPVVSFQHKYYYPLLALIWGVIPISIAMYFFDESFFSAFCANNLRYVIGLHLTWSLNSVAHLYGMRQYDRTINPRNNSLIIYFLNGEGYHNYHHVFPYDYSTSEFGWKGCWNPPTAFIDFFAWIGQAYDMKVAPKELIVSRTKRTGDVELYKQSVNYNYWFHMVKGMFGMFFAIPVAAALQQLYKTLITSGVH